MKKSIRLRLSIVINAILIIVICFAFTDQIIAFFKSKEEPIAIVFFGDSIVDDGNWGELLKRNDIKKSGFRGFTTSHYRWILKDSVLIYKPKICFIIGGINDIGSGIPLERTKLNYINLIDSLVSNNVLPIVQSTLYQVNNPHSKIQVDSLNVFLSDYCAKKSITYLNINSKLSSKTGLKTEFSVDGTHLNNKAYVVWGAEINKLLDTNSIQTLLKEKL